MAERAGCRRGWQAIVPPKHNAAKHSGQWCVGSTAQSSTWLTLGGDADADISAVRFDELRRAGAEVCAFDKDNTLTVPRGDVPHDPIEASEASATVCRVTHRPSVQQAALEECIRVFGPDKVVIFSNSAGRFGSHGASRC